MPFFLNNLHSQAANSRFGMTLSVNSMQASGRALQTARFLQADIAHLCSAVHKLPALSLDRLFTRDQPTCRVNAATSSFSRCTLRIVHAHSGAGDLTRCGADGRGQCWFTLSRGTGGPFCRSRQSKGIYQSRLDAQIAVPVPPPQQDASSSSCNRKIVAMGMGAERR
jgi:hypothetical protein